MILLNSALCSKNFRKVGIIQSSISIFCQVVCLIVLTVYSFPAPHSSYYDVVPRILLVLLVFALLDIGLYSFLIYGLVWRKPSFLLVWLNFAPLELIIVQAILIFGTYGIAIGEPAGLGIIALILFILIASFMFHNMCVIFSARHGFIHNQEAQNTNLACYQPVTSTAIAMNSSAPPFEQCNPQHFEYNATIGQYVPCKCIYPHVPPNYERKELQGPDY